MADETTEDGFDIGEHLTQAERAGGLSLGPLESQYQELFAEALEDGVITSEERARLEKAADNLGLDPGRLLRLEQAMVASYEVRHKVRVVEHYEEPVASLAPIAMEAGGDPGKAMLLKQISQLETRIQQLEHELRVARAHINVEVDLSGLDSTVESASEDPDHYWRRIRRDPTNVDPYHDLYRIHSARGDVDAAWCVSQALVLLEGANDEERALFEQHRTRTLVSPRAGVSQSAWFDQLFHPEEEILTGQIFGIIAPAVLIGRVTTLRRDKTLHQPDPALKQDPAKSTVTAVRAITWASAILGLTAPPIYLEKDRDVGYEHIPAVPPITVVGAKVLSGPTQLEHAFMAGRHLSWYRQEHFVKTLFSSVPDLEDLFLSALIIGNPGLPIAADMKQRVVPIAKAIEPLLDAAHLDALRGHFLRFVEEGGRTNLQRWSAATEKTACRAGLLLCNDLLSACGILQAEEGKLDELTKDLLVFVTSERYFQLRKQLAIRIAAAAA